MKSHEENAILLRAKAEIERGWCQRRYCEVGRDGKISARCLLDAIQHAAFESARRYTHPHFIRFNDLTAKIRAFRHIRSLIDWNDAPDRTKDHVLSLLQELIDHESL